LAKNFEKNVEDSLGIKDKVQLQSQETEEGTSINKRKMCNFCNNKKANSKNAMCNM